nr:uncharacterized protein LOC104102482 [Nicotiana tomentosiformis]
MAAPPNLEEGQSTYRPPRFNGQYYGWWKTRMHDFIMAEDSELWDVICDRRFVPIKNLGDPAVAIPKTRKEFNDADRKAVEKNFHAKKILICGIGPNEYNRISACQSPKGIWMKDDESIQDMHTRFSSIINELNSLGETISRSKLVRKILSVLPSSWESKVNAITEAKDLQTLTIDELDGDMAYLTRRFQKMVRRNGGIPKRESSSKPKYYDLCHKCGKPGHFIKECPLLKQDQHKNNFDKAAKRNPVPDKCFKRKNIADNFVKQALAAWGDSSSESEEEDNHDDTSMMSVESEANKKKIENLKKEKDAMDEKIAHIEHERDDLMVSVIDLKETFECVRKGKEVLAKRVANIEHERDDLLVVVVNLKETIGEPKIESRPENSQKGKEVAKLGRVKSDLEKSLKWTWSSDATTAMYTNNGGNRQGIGFQREEISYNPYSKYVTVPDNWLCTHCGSSLQWYMDSGCSKHMTESTNDFPSLKALQGGSVSFRNGKKGYILGVGRIGKSLSHSIENVYYLNELKYCLLSVSQIFTNLVTGEVVLVAKRYKNIYVADFESLRNGDLNCLSVIDDDAKLWHRRTGHASFTLLNKLVRKDLVRGLPKSSFKDHKVCDVCVKGKQVRSSFNPKKEVSTLRTLDLLHMDLCGPIRVASRGGKKYIFVIVDDYSRFTWTLFLRTKDKTFEVFVAFVKRIQVKMRNNVACISGITKNFWAEAVNTACYLVNRKPKLTHLRTFGCKCFVLDNGKEGLGKFDAKSDEGILLGYSSQIKAYKVYNKRTQYVEESIYVIFDESHLSCDKDICVDQDGEPLSVLGEIIYMENGKIDMMSQVKDSNDNGTDGSPADIEEPSSSITTTEVENRVVDAV